MRKIILLLLVFLLTASVPDIIDQCGDDGARSNFPSLAACSNFSICCKLDNRLCNTTTLNQNLTLLPDNCPDQCGLMNMTRLSPCQVRLDVKNISRRGSVSYSCLLDGSPKGRKSIAIFVQPKTPAILSFVCTDDKKITVRFDRGVPISDYVDTYKVIMIENNRIVSMCTIASNDKNICQDSGRQCVCHYEETNQDYMVLSRTNVTIVVTVTRSFLSAAVNGSFSVMANVIPGPLKRLRVVNVTENRAFVQFCARTKTFFLLDATFVDGCPIWYHMWLIEAQGIPEFLNVSLPSRPDYRCLRVYLSHLSPFTNYTVIVFASGGGGQGEMSSVHFQTEMSVPTYPPEVDMFGFSRYSTGVNGDNIVPVLVIMWQKLPQEAEGGSNLTYTVQVAGSGFSAETWATETYAVLSGENITGPLSAQIWAQNVIGRTEHHTQLDITGHTDTAIPIVHCEFFGDKASVYVHLNGGKNVTQVGIHWCRKYTSTEVPGRSICKEYPETEFFNATSEEVMQFDVTLTKTTYHPEVTEQIVISYTALEKLNREPGLKQTTNAKLTSYAQGIQTMKDYDFFEDTFDHLDYSYYYDLSSDRKKRDSEFGAFGSSAINEMDEEHSLRSFLDSEPGNDLVIPPGDSYDTRYPIVFISLQTTDGLSPMGMIPVSCYFDRRKDTADVAIYEIEHDETNIYIKWNQKCDPKEPLQFRASYFLVNSATDKKCTQDVNSPEQVYDKMDKPILTQLPRGATYACFQARNNNGKSGPTFSKIVLTETIDNSNNSPGVVIAAVLAACAAVTALGIFIYCCIKRRNHFREKVKETSKFINFSQNLVPVCKPADVTEESEPNKPVSLVDSGRGASCEVATDNQNHENDLNNHIGNSASASACTSNTTAAAESNESENCKSNQIVESDEDNEQEQIFAKRGFIFRYNTSGSLGSRDSEDIHQGRGELCVLVPQCDRQYSCESSLTTESDDTQRDEENYGYSVQVYKPESL